MGRESNADDPPSSLPDYEAARLRARMRANVFNLPEETIKIDRFEIVRRLGSGAMGLVYEVIEPNTGEHLALKTIRTQNPRAIALFKKEFRALARVTHPNLVTLYELGRDGNSFFFTMELIRGQNLLRYLWGSDPLEPPSDEHPPSPVLDFERLRDVFSQLAAAVAALHDAGKLHRDLKPSNVMVTAEGRVVMMDFGFVTEQGVAMLESTQGSLVVGTPAFMPPEQSRAEKIGPEADWYSVGVTLYLALTGQLPFGGLPLAELLLVKEHQAPPQPRSLVRGIPSDLAELCLDLLHPRPAERPREVEILQRFRAAPWGHTPSSQRARVQREALRRRSIIGHSDRVSRLAEIARDDEARVVEVRGPAGFGKTTLVSHFLESVRAEGPRSIILRARCNPRDAVPVQAIDGLVDALARNLRQLAPEELAEILPRETAELVALFPVLTQVPALAGLRGSVDADGAEAAFRGLHTLLDRLARRRRLVLWIDDLQWSDLEGARRLHDLLAPPDAPPMLTLVSLRSEDADQSPAIAAVFDGLPEGMHHTITLEPMSQSTATTLAGELLLDRPESDAAWIADESEGSPLWIHELARLAVEGATRPTIAALIERRLDELSPAALSLCRLAALSPTPLSLNLAAAAGAHEQALHAGLRQALGSHLLRIITGDEGEAIAPFDDRVRRAVLASQDARALRDGHRSLAEALERSGSDDPELLIQHLRGAGELDRAQHYALVHADQRLHRGDYFGGVALLRLAHELGQDDAAAAALHRRIGDALASAGREIDAAESWMRASDLGIDRDDALDLEIRASRAFLTHGHTRDGLRILTGVLRELHLPAIDEPMGRLSALLRRGQLRLLGLRYRERPASALTRRELLACDASYSASVGLWGGRLDLAAAAQVRHLALALRIGEATRIGRAVALEALRLADDGHEPARAREMQVLAAELGGRSSDHHLVALADLADATLALQAGDLGGARAAAVKVEARLGGPGGAGWERLRARLVIVQCDYLGGDLEAAALRVAAILQEAEEVRSPATTALFTRMRARLRLAAGDRVEAGLALGTDEGAANPLGLAGWVRIAAAVEYALLSGDAASALAQLAAAAIPSSPSLLGALAVDLRIRAALIAGDAERLRGVDRELALLRRSPIPAAGALAAGLAASIAAHAGDRGASALLAPAADLLARAGLHLRAAALRWRAARVGGATSATAEVRGPVDLAALAAVHCPWPAAALVGT